MSTLLQASPRNHLNVLEVHFGVLAEVHNRSEEVEQSLVALVRFEHVDELLGA